MKFKIKCSGFPASDPRRFYVWAPAVVGFPQGSTMAFDLPMAVQYIKRCIEQNQYLGRMGYTETHPDACPLTGQYIGFK